MIAVLDEAQFLGRRVRVWRMGWSGDIKLGLAVAITLAPFMLMAVF